MSSSASFLSSNQLMDINSLFLKVKATRLSVDTDPLEAVFSSIVGSLRRHDAILSRLPQVEVDQSDLRKDFYRLRLAIESTQEVNSESDSISESTNASKGFQSGKETLPSIAPSHSLVVEDNLDKSISCGIWKRDLAPIQQKHVNDVSNDHDPAVTNSLREIKSTLRRLQKGRDDGLVNSMELDEKIKSLKDQLFEVQQKLASSASVEQIQSLKDSLAARYGRMEHQFQEYTASFHHVVDGRINANLSEVKSWFNELESSAKQRQVKLEQRVASCASEYDVAAFREGVEYDIASLASSASLLDDTARAQGKTIVALQQKNALTMFHRHYIHWTQRALKVGLFRWKQIVKRQILSDKGRKSQKHLVRKILTNILSRRRRLGFTKWVRHHEWLRKMERRQLKATTLICERLGLCFSVLMSTSLNQWRRLTLLDRTKCTHGASILEINCDARPAATPKQPLLDLFNIMGSFKGDVQGAMFALAQEIMNVRSHSIPSLRQEWCAENQEMMTTIRTEMDVAIQRVVKTADVFRDSINKRVDNCANDLPTVHFQLNELSILLESNKLQLKRVDSSHSKQIDTILAQERIFQLSMSALEERTNDSASQITSMMGKQEKSSDSIQYLRESMDNNERRYKEEREQFQHALDHFGDELLKTKVSLGHTRVRCESLEKELTEVKLELAHFQDASQAESDRVQSHIQHAGLRKPSLNRIVNVGHAYEALCKEKNYVTGINITVTLRSSIAMKMKRIENRVRKTEDVGIPSEIAAFAHDYAAWIAYHADHESLLRLIAGSSPENQVYAEDDTISRRKELCVELKSELGTLLEQASSAIIDASKNHDYSSSTHNSTRGLGLRWEARAIFLARIVDSVNAALPSMIKFFSLRPLELVELGL